MMYPVLNGMAHWFDNAFDDFFDTRAMNRMNATAPAVNVKEDEHSYTMEVAVPGIKKDFVRVSLNPDGDMELAIENKLEHKEEDGKHYLRREFSYSNYQQVYTLPEDVDKNKISARVEDGVLTITLPKLVEEKKSNVREINIQ